MFEVQGKEDKGIPCSHPIHLQPMLTPVCPKCVGGHPCKGCAGRPVFCTFEERISTGTNAPGLGIEQIHSMALNLAPAAVRVPTTPAIPNSAPSRNLQHQPPTSLAAPDQAPSRNPQFPPLAYQAASKWALNRYSQPILASSPTPRSDVQRELGIAIDEFDKLKAQLAAAEERIKRLEQEKSATA